MAADKKLLSTLEVPLAAILCSLSGSVAVLVVSQIHVSHLVNSNKVLSLSEISLLQFPVVKQLSLSLAACSEIRSFNPASSCLELTTDERPTFFQGLSD